MAVVVLTSYFKNETTDFLFHQNTVHVTLEKFPEIFDLALFSFSMLGI